MKSRSSRQTHTMSRSTPRPKVFIPEEALSEIDVMIEKDATSIMRRDGYHVAKELREDTSSLRTSQRDSRCALHADGHCDLPQPFDLSPTRSSAEGYLNVSLCIEICWGNVSWAPVNRPARSRTSLRRSTRSGGFIRSVGTFGCRLTAGRHSLQSLLGLPLVQ